MDELRTKVNKLIGRKEHIEKERKATKIAYTKALRDLSASEKTQIIIQSVAKQTQEMLSYRITELGTMALQAVMEDDRKLYLDIPEKRGKTEAEFFFDQNDRLTKPLEEDSGGAADITALALRPSLWTLKKPRLRAVMVLDEPLKNINDETRIMQGKAAEMIKLISTKLGIQFLIVTMLPELEEVADKVIKL